VTSSWSFILQLV